jgi:hypothetical protein
MFYRPLVVPGLEEFEPASACGAPAKDAPAAQPPKAAAQRKPDAKEVRVARKPESLLPQGELPLFDPGLIPTSGAVIQIIGEVGHGKTEVAINILKTLVRRDVQRGYIICDTEQGFDKYWPSSFQIPAVLFDVEQALRRLLDAQKYELDVQKLDRTVEPGHALILFDDASHLTPLFKGNQAQEASETMQRFLTSARHLKTYTITCNQHPSQLGGQFRDVATMTILVGHQEARNINSVRKAYFPGETDRSFREWYRRHVSQYSKLVMFQGTIYLWKITPRERIGDFKLGSETLWSLHRVMQQTERTKLERMIERFRAGEDVYDEARLRADHRRAERRSIRRRGIAEESATDSSRKSVRVYARVRDDDQASQ